MHGKLGLEFNRKTLGSIPCVQCFRVSVPPAVRPTLLRQMDMGSLTCEQIWVRPVHTKREVRHKHVCTRVDSAGQNKARSEPAPSGDRTQGLPIEFQLSNHLDTSPVNEQFFTNSWKIMVISVPDIMDSFC